MLADRHPCEVAEPGRYAVRRRARGEVAEKRIAATLDLGEELGRDLDRLASVDDPPVRAQVEAVIAVEQHHQR